jgi:cell division septal protein FtsQ
VTARRGKVRRSRSSAAARLRPFWPLIIVGIVVVAGLVAFCVTWPGFAPKAVTVGGNSVVPRAEIVDRAGVSTHLNLWLQNPHAIASRVEAIPYVERAAVHRVPPATIAIWVTERTPFAILRGGSDEAVVDRKLRVLGPVPPGIVLPFFDLGSASLPDPGAFVTTPRAVALRKDYDALVGAHVIPVSLGFDRFGGLVATMSDGIKVLLGDDDDLDSKLRLIDPILAQIVRKARRVAAVDLRAPGTPVLVYK